MKHQVIVTPEAEREMAEAFEWYEDHVSGLGNEYLLSLDSIFYTIANSPLQFPVVYRNVRRALMRRFPYEIFFVLKIKRVIILAVHHAKRNPTTWEQRLDKT